jgi:hypothetical protein
MWAGVVKMDTWRMASPWEGMGIPAFLVPDNRLAKKRNTLKIMQGANGEGYVAFDKPIYIPRVVRRRSKDVEFNRHVVMSMTPMEVISQRPGVRKARGNVLIGGLGMGWLVRRVCEKRSVKHVTVCEIHQGIAQFFGYPLKREFKHLDIEVIDVYDHLDSKLYVYDTILMDIWTGGGDAELDRRFEALMAAHPRVWGWRWFPEAYKRRWMRKEYQAYHI